MKTGNKKNKKKISLIHKYNSEKFTNLTGSSLKKEGEEIQGWKDELGWRWEEKGKLWFCLGEFLCVCQGKKKKKKNKIPSLKNF